MIFDSGKESDSTSHAHSFVAVEFYGWSPKKQIRDVLLSAIEQLSRRPVRQFAGRLTGQQRRGAHEEICRCISGSKLSLQRSRG
jgi:hypothetical protein